MSMPQREGCRHHKRKVVRVGESGGWTGLNYIVLVVVQLSAIWDASARDSLRPDRISTSPSFRRTPEWARWDRVSPGRSRLDSLAAVSALGVHREDVNDWSSAS
ncbi:hypothetical protein GE21DRAFT_1210839 [Neurospora crassa]|nr:hypothetical protein GE21DRAFT_1210839 [Neurospora crassa]